MLRSLYLSPRAHHHRATHTTRIHTRVYYIRGRGSYFTSEYTLRIDVTIYCIAGVHRFNARLVGFFLAPLSPFRLLLSKHRRTLTSVIRTYTYRSRVTQRLMTLKSERVVVRTHMHARICIYIDVRVRRLYKRWKARNSVANTGKAVAISANAALVSRTARAHTSAQQTRGPSARGRLATRFALTAKCIYPLDTRATALLSWKLARASTVFSASIRSGNS